jgi:hypothetical protein
MRLGVNPAWKSALIRSWRGGSIAMNSCCASSRSKPYVVIWTPPTKEEYVRQSRLTVFMSSWRVTDQYPASSGFSLMPADQWTGHCPRSSLNSSCGKPFFQLSSSATHTSSILRSVDVTADLR